MSDLTTAGPRAIPNESQQMKTPSLLIPLVCLALAGCMTSSLRNLRHREALPGNEIDRTPRTLTGRKIANSRFDVWRFQGALITRDAPRFFDLYLPKKRSDFNASIREVTSAKTPAYTGETISACFDMRCTSRMMLEDPKYRKPANLVIGESIANKGKNLSVGLREGARTHHWYAHLDLEWVKRNKALHTVDNASYLLTVPADVFGYLGGAAAEGVVDDAIDEATNPLRN